MSTDSKFLQQVKDALSHLYDYPYLENHPLALLYWPESNPHEPNRAQRLYRLLLENIEELHPSDTAVKGTSRAEYYFLLVYRYVEEWPLEDIIQQLGYSRRHFFRQQHKAIEMLAGLLQEKIPQQQAPPAEPSDTLDNEVERFLTRRRAIDPGEVVQSVLKIVNQLAQAHQVTLTYNLEAQLPVIYGSRTLLRQVLLNTLSHLITQPGSQQIHLELFHEKQRISVNLSAKFSEAADGGQKVEPKSVRHLVEMMQGNWQVFEHEDYGCTCRFDFPVEAEKIALVIEDNEAVIQAFRRYLAGYSYQVIGATAGTEALRLAKETDPTVITLDVMIPGQDGWEILHLLKHDPATQHIPVIICSVLEDPQLARSLGAAAYLRKPVAQSDLVAMLDRVSGR